MHTFVSIVKSLGEVVAIGIVLGAGLPILCGVGIRFWSLETVGADGAVARRNPVYQAVAYICFAIVLAAIVAGILYVAKDFISHTFDVQLFGAKPPKK
ncbi:hypothetical protein ACWDSJ_31595 [Nocardia sp. NPDC003482]